MLTLATILARAAIAFIFIFTGLRKAAQFDGTAGFMASKGMPFSRLLLVGTIALEVLGGLFLLLGYHAQPAALALALFLVPVTLVFHAFWSAPPAEHEMQLVMFAKNLAIIGGLLLLAVNGSGALSLDAP